jgi:hypothetical protein
LAEKGARIFFAELANAGAKEIYAEHINCEPYILKRLEPALAHQPADVRQIYEDAKSEKHRQELDKIVHALVKKYGFHLRLGEVIYHRQKRER